jgi:hypothetical protein
MIEFRRSAVGLGWPALLGSRESGVCLVWVFFVPIRISRCSVWIFAGCPFGIAGIRGFLCAFFPIWASSARWRPVACAFAFPLVLCSGSAVSLSRSADLSLSLSLSGCLRACVLGAPQMGQKSRQKKLGSEIIREGRTVEFVNPHQEILGISRRPRKILGQPVLVSGKSFFQPVGLLKSDCSAASGVREERIIAARKKGRRSRSYADLLGLWAVPRERLLLK